MDNLRDLVVNAEFLGRKHVDLRMRPNMASGLDSRPTSKESNDGQTGSDIGWRWCLLFAGEWGEAQEYLDRHHAMSKTHHNYYASIPRRESDRQSSLFGRTCPWKPEVLIDLSDSAYPLYAYTALHYRPLHDTHQTCQTSLVKQANSVSSSQVSYQALISPRPTRQRIRGTISNQWRLIPRPPSSVGRHAFS
ncbi:unnamed protein product [Spirodela intermedia]|uniref:Uncharacterized protein n=1 Tax=Spirodela intermedia TaxID=51605 RepID=A0A7I8KRU7_SPIIN|nr:unnamed protein product [Spirodela intermedia]